MAYKSLNQFIKELEKRGELLRITTEVSSDLEITEITDRVSKSYGKALLFEKVKDSRYPVLINAFGTYERMSLALEADNLDTIGKQVEEYLRIENYTTFSGLFHSIPRLLRLLACFPVKRPFTLKKPACQQVIEKNVDLDKIPILKCWPLDGGRFVTLPLVFTKYPDSRGQNMGMYRMQVLDKETTAMHWHKHKDGAGIYEAYRRMGKRMPVSVAIGSNPAVTYAATAPLPPKIDEMFLAGFLRRRPVAMVKCVTNDIYVPADSQFVLEGYVDPEEELAWEGPFGDHTGYYSLAGWYPRFHVTCITHRKDAVYPATVVGRPPMEDCYLAKATERIFLPMLKFALPQLVNMNLPLEGVFHNCAILSVKCEYPGTAQTVMNFLWGMGQMRYTKLLIAIGESIDPYDLEAVKRAILERVDFERDITISRGPLDALDHSSNEALFGSRVGVDATGEKRFSAEEGIGVYAIEKTIPFAGKKKAKEAAEAGEHRLSVVVDAYVDTKNTSEVMWRVFNNIDASRDFVYQEGRLAIDATKKLFEEGLKHPWPEDIVMSDEIKKLVDSRWTEYGIDRKEV
ncbi:MAG: menaquinone biosynthesis decarboxylase [Acetivibrio ethanolgignens]